MQNQEKCLTFIKLCCLTLISFLAIFIGYSWFNWDCISPQLNWMKTTCSIYDHSISEYNCSYPCFCQQRVGLCTACPSTCWSGTLTYGINNFKDSWTFLEGARSAWEVEYYFDKKLCDSLTCYKSNLGELIVAETIDNSFCRAFLISAELIISMFLLTIIVATVFYFKNPKKREIISMEILNT